MIRRSLAPSALILTAALVASALHAPVSAAAVVEPPSSGAQRTESAVPPWDVTGSQWTGTISTTIRRVYFDPGVRRLAYSEQATYTDLQSQESNANGRYSARVAGSGTHSDHQAGCTPDLLSLGNSASWQLDRNTATDQFFTSAVELTTDDSGRTTLVPYLVAADHRYESRDCDGAITRSTGSATVLGFQSGESGARGTPPPLPDTDPDPLRLVGSRTWTLADPPYPLWGNTTEYSFTVDYDLTLELPPGVCRTHNAAFVGKLDELKMFRYALDDLQYCRGNGRVTIQDPGTASGTPIYPAGFGGALAALGMSFKYDGSGPVRVFEHGNSADATVRGRFRFCMDLPTGVLKKGVKVVLDRLPRAVRSKIYGWLDRGAEFFVRKMFSRLVPGWVPRAVLGDGLDAAIEKTSFSPAFKRALRELYAFARDEAGGQFEDFLVGLVTDGICVPKVWNPEITVIVPSSGAPRHSENGPQGIFTVERWGG